MTLGHFQNNVEQTLSDQATARESCKVFHARCLKIQFVACHVRKNNVKILLNLN